MSCKSPPGGASWHRLRFITSTALSEDHLSPSRVRGNMAVFTMVFTALALILLVDNSGCQDGGRFDRSEDQAILGEHKVKGPFPRRIIQ